MALTKTLSKRGRKDGESVKRKSSVSKLEISAPVELISTTNMISYTAPTLHNSPLSATCSPTINGRFFPLSASPSTSTSGSPSASDIESPSPPSSPAALKPNHLSTYFSPAPVPPPMSPARSLSVRSTVSIPSKSPQRSASTSSTASRQQRKSQGPPPRASHRGITTGNPFGAELAKVSELAEEYGLNVGDVEEEYMFSHGLQKFRAEDYLQEIGGMYSDEFPLLNPGWI
ncbi:hypothetical protein BDZ91DRAFT_792320 [Kalaharituber pfeilii]|nr:hypothetical protein BDZ91DRAFT_792320 [Kalaharituber pfeilii]